MSGHFAKDGVPHVSPSEYTVLFLYMYIYEWNSSQQEAVSGQSHKSGRPMVKCTAAVSFGDGDSAKRFWQATLFQMAPSVSSMITVPAVQIQKPADYLLISFLVLNQSKPLHQSLAAIWSIASSTILGQAKIFYSLIIQ
ncbi:hypothetical protein Ancab_013940 [Ancistrocladus abbreviatus]